MPFNLALSNATVAEYLAWVRSALGESTYQNILQSSPQALNFDRVITLEEQYLYGSKRLGVRRPGLEMARAAHNPSGYELPVEPPSPTERFGNDCLCNERLPDDEEPYYPGAPFTVRFYTHTLGMKEYEITNHLGNVLATVLDRKTGVKASPTATTYAWFKADVSTAQDYYPFGSHLPGRTYVAPTGAGYRFGFNGQQRDDEIAGRGNSMSALFLKYDARLGRRWNIDPVNIPSFSSYSTFMNNPILSSDPFGDKVKNGYDRDLQRANEKVKERTDALNQAQTRIGAAIGKARLAQAERRLPQINELHRETENLILTFEELNSTGFNDLDRLQDGNGTEVDVYLRIESNLNGRRFSTNIGEMEAERDLDGLTQVALSSRSPVVKDDRSGIYLPVRSALYGKNTAVIIIDKNVHDKVRVLTHESGHAMYNVSKMLEHVIWLIDNPTTPLGGHGEGNPSGIEAYRRENEYFEKRK